MLVTTSDDNTIKIWRSRNRSHQLGLNIEQLEQGVEIRNEKSTNLSRQKLLREPNMTANYL